MNARRMLLGFGLLALLAGSTAGAALPAQAQPVSDITLTGFRTMPPPDPKPDDPKKPKRAVAVPSVAVCVTRIGAA